MMRQTSCEWKEDHMRFLYVNCKIYTTVLTQKKRTVNKKRARAPKWGENITRIIIMAIIIMARLVKMVQTPEF